MKVKLISHSKSSDMDSDFPNKPVRMYRDEAQDIVAYCARVSNPSNQDNTETNEKLLKYLIKHKHWSPFEMVSACMEIQTTRDIARQILRHRSFSFQEFSQRYANPIDELEFETREARLQDANNRQNSVFIYDKELQETWEKEQKRVIALTKQVYQWAISKGIAKEQARAVLPEGLTQSKLYVNGTLRSWIHFIELRSANGTQKECAEVAKACAKAISGIFPLVKEFVSV